MTLHLVRVADPTAFGCVPTDDDGRVLAFLEKTPTPPTDQINAGCYVFRRDVLDAIPAGRPVSVERETFPGLLESGRRLQGHVESSYWLDLGTPASFVRGSADLVRGRRPPPRCPAPSGTALLLAGAKVAPSASLTDGTTVGADVQIGDGSRVSGSVLMDGARIGDGVLIERSVIGPGATHRRRHRGPRRGGRRRRRRSGRPASCWPGCACGPDSSSRTAVCDSRVVPEVLAAAAERVWRPEFVLDVAGAARAAAPRAGRPDVPHGAGGR